MQATFDTASNVTVTQGTHVLTFTGPAKQLPLEPTKTTVLMTAVGTHKLKALPLDQRCFQARHPDH